MSGNIGPGLQKDTELPTTTDRIGTCKDYNGKWDNGLYIRGTIQSIPVDILVDSGSTSTLVSHLLYQRFPDENQPGLQQADVSFVGIDGSKLIHHGIATVEIQIGDSRYFHPVVVCDIDQDTVRGQDFLLRHVKKIDYKKLELTTNNDVIQCWIGGESSMVCAVHTTEHTELPPRSRMMIPVKVENPGHLHDVGLIEQNVTSEKVMVTPGVIDVRADPIVVQVTNFSENSVKLHPNARLTSCESLYIRQQTFRPTERCSAATITEDEDVNQPDKPPVLAHLQDLYEQSSMHLSREEKEKLANLLSEFSEVDVFSKSKEDLGKTNQVLHRINTGTAAPIRQPHRRLPFCKRETEKEEVQKMIDRGVTEPSSSPWS